MLLIIFVPSKIETNIGIIDVTFEDLLAYCLDPAHVPGWTHEACLTVRVIVSKSKVTLPSVSYQILYPVSSHEHCIIVYNYSLKQLFHKNEFNYETYKINTDQYNYLIKYRNENIFSNILIFHFINNVLLPLKCTTVELYLHIVSYLFPQWSMVLLQARCFNH